MSRLRHLLPAVAVVLALVLVLPVLRAQSEGSLPAYVADLVGRRARLAAALGSETLLVLWSAPTRVYSTDTNYEYRQESNLLYLTGIDQPATTLVLAGDGSAMGQMLFVRASDPFRELWEGHTLTPAEVTSRSGVATVRPQIANEAFDRFIENLFGDPPSTEAQAFTAALAAGRARIALLADVDRAPVSDEEPHVSWARALAQRHPGLQIVSAAPALTRLRQIKTPYEQGILRRSAEMSAEAHVAGMKATRPGAWEYEVEAAVESWFHGRGALSWGYPSIVASGPNATTLHYVRSTRQMQAGELLLVDAAGNYQGLTADITRTYPVSRRFSPDQRLLYELVLEAENAGIAAARPGGEVEDITRAVRTVLGAGLLKLGLVTDASAATGESDQISLWFPHGPTHGIGMDVHEPIDRLEPGTAFVVEPGLYIREDVLNRLRQDPARIELAHRIAPVVARFGNVGIRIEDSILMTATGPEVLSAKAPRLVREIEKVVGTAR